MAGFVSVPANGLNLYELFAPHVSRANQLIKSYIAAFVVNEEPFGSGKFIKVGGFEGILTANHVAEELCKQPEFSLCVSEKVDWPEIVSPEMVVHVPIGSPKTLSLDDDGPDLSFIIIKDAGLLKRLAKSKSFFPLDDVRSPSLRPFANTRQWGIAGTYYDSFKRLEENYKGTGKPLSKMAFFVGAGVFSFEEFEKDGFDIVKLSIPAGSDGFPHDYHAISGGGFWFITFEISPPIEGQTTMDLNTIRHCPPLLAGVEFAQSKRKNGERVLTGHGPKSIYINLRRLLNSLYGCKS